MTITLDSMASMAMLSQGSSPQASVWNGQSSDPFAIANQRIDQKINSTNVQLSAYGQISSGFANVQSASKALPFLKQQRLI